MKSYVSNLYDCRQLTVPEEMTRWRIAPEEVARHLEVLARGRAQEIPGDTVQAGDSVRLRCVQGTLADRTVLLYPGLALPGAEEAERAVTGLRVGDTLTADLNGSSQRLAVEEICRRVSATVDDALVQAEGVEGVTTLEEYRRWYQAQAEEQNKENARKSIASFLLEAIRERSVYALDPEEMEEWAGQRARAYFDECIAMGADPHIPEEGTELLTDEEALARMKEQAAEDFKSVVVCGEICRRANVSLAWEDVRKEFEEMMPPDEDLDMTEEELEQARQDFMENIPVTKAFSVLCGEADRYLEG